MGDGKNSLNGDKKAEWLLGPTTPDQHGQNTDVLLNVLNVHVHVLELFSRLGD